MTMNSENCMDVKEMTALEAIQAMKSLASKAAKPVVGVGIWEGKITGTISGETYEGKHIAVFQDTALVSPFGPHGDEESEAMAVLFVTAIKYASAVSDSYEAMLSALEVAEIYLEDGATATALQRIKIAVAASKRIATVKGE